MDSDTARPEEADRQGFYTAPQWKLIWRRFKHHRMAVPAAILLVLLYMVALFPEFLASQDPRHPDGRRPLLGPQRVHFFRDGGLHPFVYGQDTKRNLDTLRVEYTLNKDVEWPVHFLVRGFPYKLLGVFKTDWHLFAAAPEDQDKSVPLHILGTDTLGRDMWSRLIHGARISLFIGLTGVTLGLFAGTLLGGLSGYYGGIVDILIQRVIDFLGSLPTLPLWMALAAAVPRDWSVTKTYFAMTLILSVFAWTGTARTVRGRFLALREEEYVMAARAYNASALRIIFRHMLPVFASHLIAVISLAVPAMILAETSLSFLGLGMRPPAISWGVLLQAAQNIQAVATASWLLIPGLAVVIVVLAFAFFGDGLRDAADPYKVI